MDGYVKVVGEQLSSSLKGNISKLEFLADWTDAKIYEMRRNQRKKEIVETNRRKELAKKDSLYLKSLAKIHFDEAYVDSCAIINKEFTSYRWLFFKTVQLVGRTKFDKEKFEEILKAKNSEFWTSYRIQTLKEFKYDFGFFKKCVKEQINAASCYVDYCYTQRRLPLCNSERSFLQYLNSFMKLQGDVYLNIGDYNKLMNFIEKGYNSDSTT